MAIRKVILALRNLDDINSLKDKRVFWKSFINLQKNLPSNIQIQFILQNNKGKESKLYSFLFEPFVEFNFNKDNISLDLKEYKKYISFTRNISNQINFSLKESYFISSISSYLINEKIKFKFDQLILLDFNLLNLNVYKSVFIYDNLLPLNKIYLRYSDYIDQGYCINLIIIPKQFLEIFSRFNDFFLSSISNGNKFLNQYKISGWPLFIVRKAIEEILFKIKNYFKNLIIIFLKLIENRILIFIDIRILRFIVNKVKIIINIPNLTRENSYVKESFNQAMFDLTYIYPIKPIFKYFINQNYLRKNTRFISDDDFENYKDCYFIGKKDFILVLRDDFSLNEKTIQSELYNLKLKPKFTVFVKKNKIITYKYFQKSNRFFKEIFLKNKKDEYQNILFVLFKIKNNNKFSYPPPIIILNSLSTFKFCTDISYLNSLLQFFIWEDVSYVSFSNINSKKKHSEFPYLYSYSEIHKPNLEKCIINFKLLKLSKYNIPIEFKSKNNNDILSLNKKKKLFL